MTEAFLILSTFAERLVQVHVSEVNSESQHDPISYGAKLAFQQVAELIPQEVPIIVESRVPEDKIADEIESAWESLAVTAKRDDQKIAARPLPLFGSFQLIEASSCVTRRIIHR
jgi:hypothetical protein